MTSLAYTWNCRTDDSRHVESASVRSDCADDSRKSSVESPGRDLNPIPNPLVGSSTGPPQSADSALTSEALHQAELPGLFSLHIFRFFKFSANSIGRVA